MKVIFGSRDTADPSTIALVHVSDVNGKIGIIVHHHTKRTLKPSCINFRTPIHFNPRREMDKALAAEIVAEIEHLTKHPEMPIEEVIVLKAWSIGCLGVDLKTATDVQATHALARLCANWSIGRNNAPREEQLEQRTGLDICTIHRIAATDDYKQCVVDLLFNGSLFEPRTVAEFKPWAEGYAKRPEQFGERMRIRELR